VWISQTTINWGEPSCKRSNAQYLHPANANSPEYSFEWGGNRLDLFFANAGTGESDSMYKAMHGVDGKTGLPKALNLKTMDINLDAVIQGIHLARYFFTEKNNTPGGTIIANSGVVGIYAIHPLPMYTATKYGVVGLVRALAPVYYKDNITINCLCPTLVDTNLIPKHIIEEFNVTDKELTPMSTVLKAIDRIVTDRNLTGQIMELTLGEVVFKHKPEYSRPNIKWMFDSSLMWERMCERLMPREPGENVKEIVPPAEYSF
jgi:15-hydroxyprostaglandin dehydrogenase (NAD)